MVGKRILSIISLVTAGALLTACTASGSGNNLKDKKVIKIGISQLVEHPALDSARQGFIDALKDKGFEEGKNIEISVQNAQGDIATAQSISQKFISSKQDMIFAIATPAAQAAYNSTKKIPILVTAVTDPVGAGLAKTMDKPATNVTGTSDNVTIEKQFKLLKDLIPTAKKVGILYNTSENNSEIQLKKAKEAAPQFNLEIISQGITSVNEASQALSSLIGKIDVMYIPTDNMVASSLPLISDICFKNNIPIIGAEKAHVEQGALASNGIDYKKLGYETGLKAVEIINGKAPQDISISELKEMSLVINTDAAKKLNIVIPEDMLTKAEKVTGGVK